MPETGRAMTPRPGGDAWTRGVFRGLLWFSAASFAALAATAAALWLTGGVGARQWRGALAVLRGTSEAVPSIERRRMQEELEGFREVVDLKEPALIDGWRALERKRLSFEERKKQESDGLKAFAARAGEALSKIENEHAAWKAEEEKKERERLARDAKLKRVASEKLRRIYRYMRPDEVARDLEQHLAGERGAEKVAAIISMMSERQAAEVLEAVPDPGRRARIYEAMAGGRLESGPPDRVREGVPE